MKKTDVEIEINDDNGMGGDAQTLRAIIALMLMCPPHSLAVAEATAAQPLQAEMFKRGHDTKNCPLRSPASFGRSPSALGKRRVFNLEKDILTYSEAKKGSGLGRLSSSGKDEKAPELQLKGSIALAPGRTHITVRFLGKIIIG